MADHSLEATVRADAGTGAARACRRDGKVPAIVYGGNADPVTVALELREVNRALGIPGLMAMTISLSIDGKAEDVRLQDVQRHPVRDDVLHIDFKRLSA